MEVYMKLATPGDQHKSLAAAEGNWDTLTKSWMDPSQPPVESKGTCTQKMILGGRFLQQDCASEMMGHPFNGTGVTGYDNFKKKYVATWMDSMGTGVYMFEGTGTPDGKEITFHGGWEDPVEGPMKVRSVSKFVDANTSIFEMYGTGKSGKEMKMMEITYTRKK
jgi:hypothetical protein